MGEREGQGGGGQFYVSIKTLHKTMRHKANGSEAHYSPHGKEHDVKSICLSRNRVSVSIKC